MHARTLLLLAALVGPLSGSAQGQVPAARAAAEPDKPLKQPVAPTQAQIATIREGITLHDQGKYDEAIALYQSVLAESPDCLLAIGELATSYAAKTDHAKAIEFANRALEYNTADRAMMYIVLGSAYDDLGQTDKAIDTYKQGIAANPHGLLYYNLGLTLERQQRIDEALDQFKHAAWLTPNHASTHAALARIFARKGYLSQSLFAFSRFLVLEPASQRTGAAYQSWYNGFQLGMQVGADGKLNVQVRTPPDKGEGYFLQMDVTVGVSRAGVLAGADGIPASQLIVRQLDFWFTALTKTEQPEADRTAFAWRYYVPYFAELQRLGYTEPFVYWVSQRTNVPGVQEWIADPANRQRATEFVQWSQKYVWPKDTN